MIMMGEGCPMMEGRDHWSGWVTLPIIVEIFTTKHPSE